MPGKLAAFAKSLGVDLEPILAWAQNVDKRMKTLETKNAQLLQAVEKLIADVHPELTGATTASTAPPLVTSDTAYSSPPASAGGGGLINQLAPVIAQLAPALLGGGDTPNWMVEHTKAQLAANLQSTKLNNVFMMALAQKLAPGVAEKMLEELK